MFRVDTKNITVSWVSEHGRPSLGRLRPLFTRRSKPVTNTLILPRYMAIRRRSPMHSEKHSARASSARIYSLPPSFGTLSIDPRMLLLHLTTVLVNLVLIILTYTLFTFLLPLMNKAMFTRACSLLRVRMSRCSIVSQSSIPGGL
jgi:hypothetical protein